MEIIKPGKAPLLEQECPECGCVFRYNLHTDVCYIYTQRKGTEPREAFVACPCCRKSFRVPRDKWPDGLLL